MKNKTKLNETISMFDNLTDSERIIVMSGYECSSGEKIEKDDY